jgi:hypothetical protein
MSDLVSAFMIPNPRYPGAPARMADGRLFTNYRANCSLLPPLRGKLWADYTRRDQMLQNGAVSIAADRSMLSLRAGASGCVDTMVPELRKRVYTWKGPIDMVSHPVGIGSGRMYLPGQTGLVVGDPDSLAYATIPDSMMPGTFSPNPHLYSAAPVASMGAPVAVPAQKNRYSMPYGN